MFNGSFLRVRRIFRFVKKIRFCLLECGQQSMVPGFGVWAECQSIGTSGKNEGACYLAPKTLSWCIF